MTARLARALATCAVAAAGAVAAPVFAADLDAPVQDMQPTPITAGDNIDNPVLSPTPIPNIGSESESVGEFGTDDTFVDDILGGLMDDVSGSGFDFVSPSPSPSPAGDVFFAPSPTPLPTPDVPILSDPPSGGGEDFVDTDDVSGYANYNTYYGSIGSTYLEYMRGFLPKLRFRQHYVASRTSQYNYIFAFGEDLAFTGSYFTGNGVTVITWSTYQDGSYSVGFEPTFNLNPGSFLVYSDLSDIYPSLADTAGFTLRQILILLTTFILGAVIDHMYQVRKVRRVK